MEFTITTTRKNFRQKGATLVEVLVTMGISGFFFSAVATCLSYNARSCVALANYADLNMDSRYALDTITTAIRQSNRLLGISSNKLDFEMVHEVTGATNTLTFSYDSEAGTLTRQYTGINTVLLKDITPGSVNFSIYQRNPIGGTVDQFPTTNAALCKVVQLSWICSRSVLGKVVNSQSAQSAKVSIRRE